MRPAAKTHQRDTKRGDGGAGGPSAHGRDDGRPVDHAGFGQEAERPAPQELQQDRRDAADGESYDGRADQADSCQPEQRGQHGICRSACGGSEQKTDNWYDHRRKIQYMVSLRRESGSIFYSRARTERAGMWPYGVT